MELTKRAGTLLVVVLCILSPAARADLTLVSRMTTATEPALFAPERTETVTEFFRGDRIRVEMAAGGRVYLYDRPSGEGVILDPARKTYARVRLDLLARANDLLMESRKATTTATVQPAKGDSGSDNKTVAGKMARRYTFAGTSRARSPRETITGIVGELWTTDAVALPGGTALRELWLRELFARTLGPGAGPLKTLVGKIAALPGLPLSFTLTLAVAPARDAVEAEGSSTKITREVQAIRQEPLDPALFEIPDGYREAEMTLGGNQDLTPPASASP